MLSACTMPSMSKTKAVLEYTEHDMPALNADALQSLKQNIENKFKQTTKPSSKPETPKPGKEKTKKSREDKKALEARNTKASTKIPAPEQIAQASTGSQAKPKATPIAIQSQKSSKKRLRNGEIKQFTPGQKGKGDVNSTNLGQRKVNEKGSSDSDLRKEIRALGGSDEDYDLVADVQSDSEFEGQDHKGSDKKLEKELQQFVQGLGIAEVENDYTDKSSNEHEELKNDIQPYGVKVKSIRNANGLENANLTASVQEITKRIQGSLVWTARVKSLQDAYLVFTDNPALIRMACSWITSCTFLEGLWSIAWGSHRPPPSVRKDAT